MKGADMWDTVVRDETSLPLHVGRGLDPDVSSPPLVLGTSGAEDMVSLWESQTGKFEAVAQKGVWRGENRTDGRMEPERESSPRRQRY